MLLEIDRLTVAYGKAIGLHEFSLELAEGHVAAVIGPNGAGKTSLMRAIAGFLGREAGRIGSGSVTFAGKPIHRLAAHRVTPLGIALVPERDKIFASLTVAEQLALARRLVGRRRYEEELERVLELFPGLKKHLQRPAGYLSGGERQMVSLGSALCMAPRLLLVDELSQGLAPGITEALVERLQTVNRDGMTILLVEQNVSVAAALAEKIYVLDGGRLVAADTAPALMEHGNIVRTYLGLTDEVAA